MAAPSSLISRVLSPLSSPSGGETVSRSRLFVGPAKPGYLTLRSPALVVAFARRNKKISAVTTKKDAPSSKIKVIEWKISSIRFVIKLVASKLGPNGFP